MCVLVAMGSEQSICRTDAENGVGPKLFIGTVYRKHQMVCDECWHLKSCISMHLWAEISVGLSMLQEYAIVIDYPPSHMGDGGTRFSFRNRLPRRCGFFLSNFVLPHRLSSGHVSPLLGNPGCSYGSHTICIPNDTLIYYTLTLSFYIYIYM